MAYRLIWIGNFISHIKGEPGLKIFDDRVLRKIFRIKRAGVFYSSPNICEINSRKKRGGECIAQGEKGIHKGSWWETLKEVDDLEDLSADGNNIKTDLLEML